MKVLMINSVCGIGSTGRICTDIADELTENGHECKIAFGRKTVPERYQKYAYRITSDGGVKINALKARLFDNEGFNAAGATKKLISFIEEYNPDVIHLHNLHAGLSRGIAQIFNTPFAINGKQVALIASARQNTRNPLSITRKRIILKKSVFFAV